MKMTVDKSSGPVYCDTGPHAGSTRVDLQVRVYMSPEEHARYGGALSLRMTLEDDPHADGSQPAPVHRAAPKGAGQ